ncbi:MAG TPA: hypothetical protein G4N96_07010 [Chloroflexi bacterium]|nr:hypothetical protein [Chloroflexota bacterium]
MDEKNQGIQAALQKSGHWITIEEISAEMSLPESALLDNLQNMLAYGQIRSIEVDGQSFYRLSG